VIECDRDSLSGVASRVDALGGAEDLAAHVAAVRVRVPSADSGGSPPGQGASGAGAPHAGGLRGAGLPEATQ